MLLVQGKQYKGALFDMDGLLVDSETLSIKIAKDICKKKYNIILSYEDIKYKVGTVDKEWYLHIQKKYDIHDTVDNILKEHNKLYDKLLDKVNIFPGSNSLIKKLYNLGLGIGIVSGSYRYQIDMIIKKINIEKYITTIMSCEDYIHGKPDPESYIMGVNSLGFSNKECIGFEDSTVGIQALNKAGILSIGINNTNQNLENANIKCKTLSDFENIYL